MNRITNDFRSIDARSAGVSDLATTAGGWYERLEWLLQERRYGRIDCLAAISDPWEKVDMTMQQMVMFAATGRLEVVTPPKKTAESCQ